MPRTARIEYAGALYHVINRGNYRRDIFESYGAAEAFERTLLEACDRSGWQLHAYVVMRNHFHLAVETPTPNLSDGMKWLQGTWVMRFNRLRGFVGRPFQGRYKALHVQPGEAVSRVTSYIHLNPVRARAVAPAAVGDYRFSSLHYYGKPDRPACLEPATILNEAGRLPDTPAGWRRYREWLALQAVDDSDERAERLKKLSRGWCIGSDDFRKPLRNRLEPGAPGLKLPFAGLEPQEWVRERQLIWEAKLERAAATVGLDVQNLPETKSHPAKVQVAALMKAATDASNAWLTQRLQMGEPASVSQFVRRFRLAGGNSHTDFQSRLSIVKQ